MPAAERLQLTRWIPVGLAFGPCSTPRRRHAQHPSDRRRIKRPETAAALSTEADEAERSGKAALGSGGSTADALTDDAIRERLHSGALASSSLQTTQELHGSKFLGLVESAQESFTAEELAAAFRFPLDSFQLEAVREFQAGHSVLVCAPTGAGKTAIAEAATIAVLARGGRVIYTTPLKALSNQKLHEMRLQFGEARVGLQTGDASLNAEGDIVIMTTEVLRNILYSAGEPQSGRGGAERMASVDLVVLDEVHYLGDPGRGSVWEEVIISCPRHVRLLCMSATVRNAHDLGGWITKVHGTCTTVMTSFRPVPLTWSFCSTGPNDTEIAPLLASGRSVRLNPDLLLSSEEEEEEDDRQPPGGFRGFGRQPRSRRRPRGARGANEPRSELEPPATEDALEALRRAALLPTIWFVFSRRACDEAVLRMHARGVRLTSAAERGLISRAVGAIQRDQPEAVREAMLRPLEGGVASHHAGCLPAWKTLIELLYQQGVIKVVFATGTLAAGINMPARSTVISSITRRIGDSYLPLSHNELSQMAGRAGRRGYDTQGHCVLLQERFSEPQEAVDIIRRGPEPLASQFATGYGMVLRLLHYRTLDAAREFVQRSFFNYLADEGVRSRQEAAAEAEQQAAALLERAAEVETAAGGAEGNYESYLGLKAAYQESRKELRKIVRAACRARGNAAAKQLSKLPLPAIVGVEYATLDLGDATQSLGALLAGREYYSDEPDEGQRTAYVCLTVDNRLFRVQSKHIAEISPDNGGMTDSEAATVLSAAGAVQRWQHLKSGSHVAAGSGLTARIAARIPTIALEPVSPDGPERQAVADAQMAVDMARQAAEDARDGANEAKSSRQDLRLRAEATKLKRRAKEIRAALEATSASKDSTWRGFEATLDVLLRAGALERGSLAATPLGEVARHMNAENELWIAVVLTHPACQDLEPPKLAGVLSAMVAGEATLRPNVSARYGCSAAVIEAIEAMEEQREKLYYLQIDAGVEGSLLVDLRLSGIVEAWAAGLGWDQATADCNLDGGDIARLLSRTADLLRQAGRCEALLPGMRRAARKAAAGMARTPISDLVQ